MPKKEILERRISPALEDLIQQRKNIAYTEAGQERLRPVEGIDRYAVASGLIIVSGDVVGCILLLSGDSESKASELQVKMINVAANLLAKQLEE